MSMERKMKEGMINLYIAILVLLLSLLSAFLLSHIMKDVVSVESRIMSSVNRSYSKVLILSMANIWQKFLTENGGFWDSLQADIETSTSGDATRTAISIDSYVSYSFSETFKRNFDYTIYSTTTLYSKFDKYISVSMGIKRGNEELPYGASFEFGWPGF